MQTALSLRFDADRFDYASTARDPWSDVEARTAPLFEVPWDGNALLKPVRTVRVLNEVSAMFQNRVANRVDWFLDGQEACYLWNGTVKACITLRPDPIYGWTVREIVGVGRAEVPAEVETAILVQFATAGIRRRARAYAI